MNNLWKRTTPIVAIVAALSLGACMQSNAQPQTAQMNDTVMVGGQAMFPSKDIIDNAVNSGEHKTLVAAVKAAGLVETLKGKGPFTVFAPTDDAFAKLPAGTVEDLLKPANKDKLAKILTYHVVPGRVMAADVAGKQLAAKTVEGGTIAVDGRKGVMLNGKAKVTKADIVADNGVIHVIDVVLLPPQ